MTVINELLKVEEDGTLSFGDYSLAAKTKLEKNGMFAYESVPGTAATHFKVTENEVSFKVYGAEGSVQFTVGLAEESLYEVFVDDMSAGKMTTNLSGKLSASVEIKGDAGVEVKIVKR